MMLNIKCLPDIDHYNSRLGSNQTFDRILKMGELNSDMVQSLLEAPIEKPVLLSEAALTNLYNISHNVQVIGILDSDIRNNFGIFQDFLHYCGFRAGKKDKKKSIQAKKKKKQAKKKAKKQPKLY